MPTRDIRGEHGPDDVHLHEPCALQEALDTFCNVCGYYEGQSGDDTAHENLCCGYSDYCHDEAHDPDRLACMGHHLRWEQEQTYLLLAPGQTLQVNVPVRAHSTVTVEQYDATVEFVVFTKDGNDHACAKVQATRHDRKEVQLLTLYRHPRALLPQVYRKEVQ